ncbi:MAG TPA: PEP-CTERM-box response regulator transcription factor [Chthoniobacterales bacterium]|jgi:two-component system NtrC family response regulator|nr:PEP-CTERM-box response regulator transcription factor [Chthoniobacterales bacterium]
MMKPKILIVDDDEEIRTQLKWTLEGEYDLTLAADREEATNLFRERQPVTTLLDLGLPPQPNDCTEGLATLDAILAIDPSAKVVILSGQSERENAIKAVGAGAYDFLPKPIDPELLKLVLRRCINVVQLEREYRELQKTAPIEGFEKMLGASTKMEQAFGSIRKVAGTNAPVLLLGESGTGKELAALAIHERSPRSKGAFVPINCSGIPENLLESELFGHEKGAFTGAHVQRQGLIESAADGTLFLDEIGELPPQLQVKLLRFLQEQRFQRVGGRQEIKIDTRVIAATNADLKLAISENRFREDLYFRLAVVVIKLPPLREREDDVVLLAQDFLNRYAAQNGKKKLSLAPDAVRALYRHQWPGNVRELQNRVKRAVIMADTRKITAADLELEEAGSGRLTLRDAREAVERELVEGSLRRNRGKIAAAAAELGISRPTFYELMEKLGIRRSEPEQAETN